MDTLSKQERSERMGRVRRVDTKPEMRVRRLVHAMGYRYRLHVGSLPGCPDLVFARRRKVVFVHGCFWHRHPDPGCRLARQVAPGILGAQARRQQGARPKERGGAVDARVECARCLGVRAVKHGGALRAPEGFPGGLSG